MNIDELQAGPALDALVARMMGEPHVSAPCYSHDLNLAWLVAQRLAGQRIHLEVAIRADQEAEGRVSYFACFTRESDYCITMSCDNASAAAAICRAALKMAQQEEPEIRPTLDVPDAAPAPESAT